MLTLLCWTQASAQRPDPGATRWKGPWGSPRTGAKVPVKSITMSCGGCYLILCLCEALVSWLSSLWVLVLESLKNKTCRSLLQAYTDSVQRGVPRWERPALLSLLGKHLSQFLSFSVGSWRLAALGPFLLDASYFSNWSTFLYSLWLYVFFSMDPFPWYCFSCL